MGEKSVDNVDVATRIAMNWTRFNELSLGVGDDPRVSAVRNLLDHFSDRMPFTPASSRLEYHGAYPGGLVEHSLRVYAYAMRLRRAYGLDGTVMQESVTLAALFHDLGKVGDISDDLYVPNQSSWHRERGVMYEHNRKIPYMSNTDRSLFLLMHFGIMLTADEFIAIRLNDGMYADENKCYSMREPSLALIVHHADRMACQHERNRTSVLG